jgi:hypothetical protein
MRTLLFAALALAASGCRTQLLTDDASFRADFAAPPDLGGPDIAHPIDFATPPPDFAPRPLDFARPPDLSTPYDLVVTGDFAGQVFPAAHPPLPQVVNLGGPILKQPRLVSVTFLGDPFAVEEDKFVATFPLSDAWKPATIEYGVGQAQVQPPVHVQEKAPKLIQDFEIVDWLTAKLDGKHPEFGQPGPDSLYLLFYPRGTRIEAFGSESCVGFGGYHDALTLGNGQRVAFGVMPDCPNFLGLGETDLESITDAAAHEIFEAVTDADPIGNPAWGDLDPGGASWGLAFGVEVADMCTFSPGAEGYIPGFAYSIQRSWSNLAALQSHDPCVPAPMGEVYFNAAPALPDTLNLNGTQASGIRLTQGQSKTIELDLFSDGPTNGWTVSAEDFYGAGWDFTFDRTDGANGDKLHLTVKLLATSGYFYDVFFLRSTRGPVSHIWPVVVGR